jgi:membrane dipeptidase
MLGLPEWLAGSVAIIVSTITALPREETHTGELGYVNPEGAYQQGLAQLRIYQDWDASDAPIQLVTERAQLEAVLETWHGDRENGQQVGLVLLIENADLIREPDEVAFWHAQGVRLVGPAWHTNRYTASSMTGGALTALGNALLDRMDSLGMILDLTHMSDDACRESLERYGGPVVATHTAPRGRAVGEQGWAHPQLAHRLLADDVMEELINHGGVIGIMPANWALDPAWKRDKVKAEIHLGDVIDSIDYVCQAAGNARHVAIGTDFDGGFGAEATPAEINTIADLQGLVPALAARGYIEEDVAAIMHDNWLRMLRESLP